MRSRGGWPRRSAPAEGVEVLNDVALNQVLLRFGGDDALTDAVIGRVQEDGTCWVGGTRWHGQAAMRVSVSSWSTTEADIDRIAAGDPRRPYRRSASVVMTAS